MAALDNTLKVMQQKCVLSGKSLAGEEKKSEKTPIPTVQKKNVVNDEEMNELAESIHKY